MGPVGAGKTRAIRTISDIEVVNTDEEATDETRLLKKIPQFQWMSERCNWWDPTSSACWALPVKIDLISCGIF